MGKYKLCDFVIVFSTCIILVNVTFVHLTTVPEVNRLYGDLLQDFNRNIRPPYELRESLIVNATFSLFSVKDFDDISGTLSITGGVMLTLFDYRLQWMPSEYSNITVVTIPRSAIWVPDVVVINSAGHLKPIGHDIYILSRVYESGLVVDEVGDNIQTKCSCDMTYFPFDLQICVVQITPMNFFPHEVFLISARPDIDIEHVAPLNIWDVTSTACSNIPGLE